MLEKFRKAKHAEIERLIREEEAEDWQPPPERQRADFAAALQNAGRIAVIAEYKRASPSKGVIRTDLSVEEVARQYQAGGAAAISVLTEETYFDGRLEYLAAAHSATHGGLPILRKDFIFDPVQINDTARTDAAAVLLIARMYSNAFELQKLREHAEAYGLAAVVEIFDEADLRKAREACARIIQVNARDLSSLKVDRRDCLRLAEKGRPAENEIWIAASGINAPAHLAEAADAGFKAALVGGALMEKGQPGENLARLTRGFQGAA